ncbi:uncharacterized protein LOC100375395 [Saccoglossus kowalevskii]|uniref:Probable beta-D-xylosidase 2-like n=1 Tax=Saccoglossus kowalevskii TaxID=10224 RepID=A0ABM0MTQ6_SACKO|nr:PREDICTED: probable beta-D-xylosidase 2-like [Saccoglossus kowalevskii]
MKSATLKVLVCMLFGYWLPGNCTDYPFQDPSLSWDDRVNDLITRLTVDEITDQMALSSPAPSIDRLGIKPYEWSTECLRGDSDAGPATAFPQALGLAASFDFDTIFDVARTTAIEVRAKNNDYERRGEYENHKGVSCFSPVLNIARHPLWGRNQETYGEDPYLSGELARAFVHGLQGDHPRYLIANAGCKHFNVHGGPENIPVSRFSFNAKVSERDWRMTFLPAFHECVKAGTYSLMCSYNRINGVPACANSELLIDVLRKEWNFTGYIVSDAGAIENIYTRHHYRLDALETAIASVNSGCNLELGGGSHPTFLQIKNGFKLKRISNQTLMERIKPLFYTRMRLGEFDPVKMNPFKQLDLSIVLSDGHRELAVKTALKTIVLLKNDGRTLPLKGSVNNLAVVGPLADNVDALYGDYSATPNNYTVTPRNGLARLAGNTSYASGCDNPKCRKYDSGQVKSAVSGADMVVVCVGTGTDIESEGNDRHELALPGKQLSLLQDAVKFAGSKPVILLLFNAGPLDVSWAVENPAVQTIVACFFPAQATGDALYRMFMNTSPESNPAGRLPMTWPRSMEQVPPMTDYTMKGRTYRYSDADPLFPFGFGLSYTLFKYYNTSASPTVIKSCDTVTIPLTVTNVGDFPGDEVMQVYISWSNASVTVPKLQLVGFRRVREIEPSASATVHFAVLPRMMAIYTTQWMIEPGVYNVYAGGQQPNQVTQGVPSNVVMTSFTIEGPSTPLNKCDIQ